MRTTSDESTSEAWMENRSPPPKLSPLPLLIRVRAWMLFDSPRPNSSYRGPRHVVDTDYPRALPYAFKALLRNHHNVMGRRRGEASCTWSCSLEVERGISMLSLLFCYTRMRMRSLVAFEQCFYIYVSGSCSLALSLLYYTGIKGVHFGAACTTSYKYTPRAYKGRRRSSTSGRAAQPIHLSPSASSLPAALPVVQSNKQNSNGVKERSRN